MRRLEAQGTARPGRGLGQIAHPHRQRNAYDRSIPVYKQALAVNRRLDNLLAWPATTPGWAGLQGHGQYEAAIDHLAEGQRSPLPRGGGWSPASPKMWDWSDWQMDRLDEALVYYQEALSIAESINHLRGMSSACSQSAYRIAVAIGMTRH